MVVDWTTAIVTALIVAPLAAAATLAWWSRVNRGLRYDGAAMDRAYHAGHLAGLRDEPRQATLGWHV